MKPLTLALLFICALTLNATVTATQAKPDASKTLHESECPCPFCFWCEPEDPPKPEPHEPPPHEEPHEPPPHEEPHEPPPHEEPIPEIPELPPLPELPPIPEFCPPSKEEPEIPHYAPPPPHPYVYQSNPIIASTSLNSDAIRNYGPVHFVTWVLVAVAGYIFH